MTISKIIRRLSVDPPPLDSRSLSNESGRALEEEVEMSRRDFLKSIVCNPSWLGSTSPLKGDRDEKPSNSP